jgi:hypothetical protein
LARDPLLRGDGAIFSRCWRSQPSQTFQHLIEELAATGADPAWVAEAIELAAITRASWPPCKLGQWPEAARPEDEI